MSVDVARGRRALLRLAPLLAIAALLSACLPLPPTLPPLAPKECANHTPTSAAEYQKLFDRRTTGFASGDELAIVTRPGQSDVWLMGDPIRGRVLRDGSIEPGWTLPRNSLLSTQDRCVTPLFGGTNSAPRGLFANPTSSNWYWPGGGVAAPDGSMQVILGEMENAGIFYDQAREAVARVSPDLHVQSITALDPSRTLVNGVMVNFGGSVAADDTYAYLYGLGVTTQDGFPVGKWDQYVARVPVGDIAGGTWEYSSCVDPACATRQWVTDPNAASPMTIAGVSAQSSDDPASLAAEDPANKMPIAAFHVVRYGNAFVAVAKGSDLLPDPPNPAADQIYAWHSTTPEGPWTPLGAIGTTTLPIPGAPAGNSYGAKLIDTPAAGWILTWDSNADFMYVWAHSRAYGPGFATPVNLPPPA